MTDNLLLAEELVLADLWLWSRAAWMDLPMGSPHPRSFSENMQLITYLVISR